MEIKINELNLQAGLYIIATPIGNMADLTFRAYQYLQNMDKIYCEDTRVSKKLMNSYAINKPLVSLHEYNEKARLNTICDEIMSGKKIALISDAGTPLINDPGYLLVRHLKEHNLYVTHVPGACSPITALVLSSIAANSFLYGGFLPSKSNKRKETLEQYKSFQDSLIFLETPHRLIASLEDIFYVFGNRKVAICRELTKKFEEIIFDDVENIIKKLQDSDKILGEIVIVIEGMKESEQQNDIDDSQIEAEIKTLLRKYKTKDVALLISQKYNKNKSEIYQKVLMIKDNE